MVKDGFLSICQVQSLWMTGKDTDFFGSSLAQTTGIGTPSCKKDPPKRVKS
jgi:hypothetical protein